MKIKHFLVVCMSFFIGLQGTSCSTSNVMAYQKKAYKNKSKKIKNYRSKGGGQFKFQLYRVREETPISD